MRLYRILIRFLRVVNQLYFVDVRSVGREHVPERGPVILAANHPSSILDSILLATQIRRTINYLARSGLFRFPLLAGLFRRLGAVPIYRPDEVSDYAERNVAVFEKVFELLERGGCVGIFPEGRNSPPTRIGPMRKGAARMALGAEARNGYELGLVIVPVGVIFETRGLLMSTVLLRFGRAIRVADYARLHRLDPEHAHSRLTADIGEAITREAGHMQDDRFGQLVEDFTEVFGETLAERFETDRPQPEEHRPFHRRWLLAMAAWYRRSTPESSKAFERRMHSRRFISDVLATAWSSHPERVVALHNRLERYKDHLRQTELREAMAQSFDEPVRQRLIRLRMTMYALMMAPIALFGLLHNVLPYALTRFAGSLSRDEAVRAFVYFGVGVLAFGTTYFAIGFGLWQWTDFSLPWAMAYIATLPPTGFAALRYRRNVVVYRDRILVRTIFFNQEELIDLLRRERRRLHDEFMELARRQRD